MTTHPGNDFRQVTGGARCDNGSETAATWKYADGTCGDTIGNATGRTWAQKPDENFRLRMVVENTGTQRLSSHHLQYNHEGAGWVTIGDAGDRTKVVRASPSSGLIFQDDCTQQMGSGQFDTPNYGQNDLTAICAAFTFNANQQAEFEWCLRIDSTQVADADAIQFRQVVGASTIYGGGYTYYPNLTVEQFLGTVFQAGDRVARSYSALGRPERIISDPSPGVPQRHTRTGED